MVPQPVSWAGLAHWVAVANSLPLWGSALLNQETGIQSSTGRLLGTRQQASGRESSQLDAIRVSKKVTSQC